MTDSLGVAVMSAGDGRARPRGAASRALQVAAGVLRTAASTVA